MNGWIEKFCVHWNGYGHVNAAQEGCPSPDYSSKMSGVVRERPKM
jgi:hypothetical protein